jgi:hypothetical protein
MKLIKYSNANLDSFDSSIGCPIAASYPLAKNLAPINLLLQSCEALNDAVETHPPFHFDGGGGNESSHAKDGLSGQMPVSKTAIIVSSARFD